MFFTDIILQEYMYMLIVSLHSAGFHKGTVVRQEKFDDTIGNNCAAKNIRHHPGDILPEQTIM